MQYLQVLPNGGIDRPLKASDLKHILFDLIRNFLAVKVCFSSHAPAARTFTFARHQVQASYGLGTKVRTFNIWQARIRKKGWFTSWSLKEISRFRFSFCFPALWAVEELTFATGSQLSRKHGRLRPAGLALEIFVGLFPWQKTAYTWISQMHKRTARASPCARIFWLTFWNSGCAFLSKSSPQFVRMECQLFLYIFQHIPAMFGWAI